MNEYMWAVRFTGDYFTLTTCVNAPDQERAIQYARLLLNDHHGIDVDEAGCWDIEAETEGEYV